MLAHTCDRLSVSSAAGRWGHVQSVFVVVGVLTKDQENAARDSVAELVRSMRMPRRSEPGTLEPVLVLTGDGPAVVAFHHQVDCALVHSAEVADIHRRLGSAGPLHGLVDDKGLGEVTKLGQRRRVEPAQLVRGGLEQTGRRAGVGDVNVRPLCELSLRGRCLAS